MPKWFSVICLCAFVLLGARFAAARGAVLRVSFDPLPPWKVQYEDGTMGGIDIELLRILAGRMGLELQFTDLPFKRGLNMLQLGEVDLMIGVLRRPEREQFAFYLEPHYKDRSDKAFYVLKGSESSIEKYEDLYGLVVGTQLGSRYFPRFDKDSKINKSPVKNMDLNARMLLAGRIDTFIITEDSGDYWLARLGLTDRIDKADFGYRSRQPVYMVLSKRSPLAYRLDEFNKVLKELVDQGWPERIRKRYLADPPKQ